MKSLEKSLNASNTKNILKHTDFLSVDEDRREYEEGGSIRRNGSEEGDNRHDDQKEDQKANKEMLRTSEAADIIVITDHNQKAQNNQQSENKPNEKMGEIEKGDEIHREEP